MKALNKNGTLFCHNSYPVFEKAKNPFFKNIRSRFSYSLSVLILYRSIIVFCIFIAICFICLLYPFILTFLLVCRLWNIFLVFVCGLLLLPSSSRTYSSFWGGGLRRNRFLRWLILRKMVGWVLFLVRLLSGVQLSIGGWLLCGWILFDSFWLLLLVHLLLGSLLASLDLPSQEVATLFELLLIIL